MIERGDAAPEFELPPGCTTQACRVRDHLPAYEDADAVVLGASPDPVARVRTFHDKQYPDGRVATVLRKVKPKEHDEQVLAALAA